MFLIFSVFPLVLKVPSDKPYYSSQKQVHDLRLHFQLQTDGLKCGNSSLQAQQCDVHIKFPLLVYKLSKTINILAKNITESYTLPFLKQVLCC